MKVQIMSDIHNEFGEMPIPETDADIIVLAGDIDVGTRGVEWAKQFERPVVYVAGNHEYYGQDIFDLQDSFLLKTAKTNIFFLENKTAVIFGIRFIGCTLWADFLAFPNPAYNMGLAERCMNDYRQIRRYGKTICPEETRDMAVDSRAFIISELQKPFSGPTVVVTHHAPSIQSSLDVYKEDAMTAAYVTPMEDIITEFKPDLWVHGHMHNNSDYILGETRIICNPRGYTPMALNEEFCLDKVVDL